MKLLFFGPPGVGKGTQAKLFASEYGIPHYSTGDILRAAVAARTPIGEKVNEFMRMGQLVPDDVMIALVREALTAGKASNGSVLDGFILDGFPRTVPQAEALAEMFKELGVNDYIVVNFYLAEDEIVRRLGNRVQCPKDGKIYNTELDGAVKGSPCPQCGTPLVEREDDAPDTIRARLGVYLAKTRPVLGYYERLGKAVTVDASEPIEKVHCTIVGFVNSSKTK
jgi:adenylate kinase